MKPSLKVLMAIDEMEKMDMKLWLKTAFDKYNDLMEHMVKINVRDPKIKEQWEKVDEAFDQIINISNDKGYFE